MLARAEPAALEALGANMNRKQRRTMNKLAGKEATSTIDLMLGMPDKCHDCSASYDKSSKEMAQTWIVNVYKIMKRVELYCPDCNNKRQANVEES